MQNTRKVNLNEMFLDVTLCHNIVLDSLRELRACHDGQWFPFLPATVFLEFWKRRRAVLAYDWDLVDWENEEVND